MNHATPAKGELQGRHVLMAVLLFFAVVFAVNGIFLYSALSTYSGVVSQEPYRKGLHYNQRIEAFEKQERAGWKETLDINASSEELTFSLVDDHGSPVPGLVLAGSLGRPATTKEDRFLKFREIGPGLFTAPTGPIAPGTWVVTIDARQAGTGDGEMVFRSRKRLWLKQ